MADIEITDIDDMEDSVYELTNLFWQMLDEIEANEPLQARQTYDKIKEHIAAYDIFIAALPETRKV